MIELVKDIYYTDIDSYDNYPLKKKVYKIDKDTNEKIISYDTLEHCNCLGSLKSAIKACINEMRKDGIKSKSEEIISLREYMEEIKKQDDETLEQLKNILIEKK